MSFANQDPQPSLAWGFNETATDYVSKVSPSSANVNGAYQTTTTWPYYTTPAKSGSSLTLFNPSAPTVISNCIFFNQTTGINIPFGGANTSTVSFWFKWLTSPGGTIDNTMVFLTNNQGSKTLYFYCKNPSTSLGSYGNFSGASRGYSSGATPAATVGTWYHVAQTTTSTSQAMYINGALVGSLSYTEITGNASNVWNCLSLGTYFFGTNPSAGASVELDDLRIYDQALPLIQVQNIYNQQGSPIRTDFSIVNCLLDNISEPAAAAFSLRKLYRNYTGPCVTVRRQSDLASNIFVADSVGNMSNTLTGASLQTFLTSTYGNVTTWHDQTGNGRNATNSGANAPVIIQTSNLNMKWGLTTTYAISSGNMFLSVAGGPFINGTDFTILSTSRRTITSNSKVNNALYAYGANSGWQSYTSNLTYPDNSRFVCEFPYQGNRVSWNQRANPQNAEAFATIPYFTATEPVTYLALVSKGSTNQTTLYCNNAVVHTTAAYGQCNANVNMTSAFSIGAASSYGSFGGEIGEIIIVPSALTAPQVSQIYRSQVSTANFVGTPISVTGTPLFSQLSSEATSSAVGAFSLRAVNGGVAKAVQVVSHPMGVWPPVAMTSNVTTATGTFNGVTDGVYTASESPNAYAGQNNSYLAFDSNPTGSFWHSALTYNADGSYNGTTTQTDGYTGEWLQIQFPTPIILYSYSMINRSGWNLRTPKNFRIYGSTNGTAWTIIDTQDNITQWLWPERLEFTVTNPVLAPYSYFRMVVNATGGPNSIQISSWILNGPAAVYTTGSPTDFWADRLGKLWTTPYTGQTLDDWLGGGVGYVSALYDQSGAGNDAQNSTATTQPILKRATKGPGYMCVFSGSQGLIFGSYNLLNDTPYSTIVVNRRTDPKLVNYYLCGNASSTTTDRFLHSGYRSATALAFAQYGDDFDITVPTYVSSTVEPLFYNTMIHDTNHTGRQYAYAGGTLYPVTPATRTFLGFLNQSIGSSFSIGSGFGTFIGEIYEVLIFTKSLYDLDNTGGIITQIYQDQLGYTGA